MRWAERKLKEYVSNASISTTFAARLFAKSKSVRASGAAVEEKQRKWRFSEV